MKSPTLKPMFALMLAVLLPWLLFSQKDWNPDPSRSLPMRFESVGSEEGLPHQTVDALIQDKMGFIWLGTPIGLVKYDGYDFRVHQYEFVDSASSQTKKMGIQVRAIQEGPSGDLWVGCDFEQAGKPVIFRFDQQKEVLRPYCFDFESDTSLIQSTIRNILIGKEWIWINAGTIYRFPISSLDREQYGRIHLSEIRSWTPPKGSLFDMHRDQKDRIWLPARKGVYRWLPDRDSFVYHPGKLKPSGEAILVTQMLESTGDSFWSFPSTGDGHLIKFFPNDGSFRTQPALKFEIDLGFNPKLLLAEDNRIWMGRGIGRGGLKVVDFRSGRGHNINIQVEDWSFFPVARFQALLQDHSGVIWLGSEQGPLLKHDSERTEFKWLQFQADSKNTLSHDYITGIDQDSSGQYWISTFGGGLNQWDRDNNKIEHLLHQPQSENSPLADYLQGVAITSDGKIWFGEGFSAGAYDPVSGNFSHYRESGIVWQVYADSKDRIWLGKYTGGLRRYDPKKDDFLKIGIPDPEDPSKVIHPWLTSLYMDSGGYLWLGAARGQKYKGFFRYHPETKQSLYFNYAEARAFCEDLRGNIWIGSFDGLYKFNPEEETIERFAEKGGLPNNVIEQIQVDDRGRLWIATDNGLCRYDPEQQTFRNYFQSDGLPDNRFYYSSYKNKEGELFFGSMFGVLYFHPDSITDNLIPPKLAFTGLDIFSTPLPISEDGPLKEHLSRCRSIQLPHDQNDLTLHYAALHYKNPQKNQYRIWLENYDRNWRDVGNQRAAQYTNLDPGRYTFHVKAANSDGIWNEEAISLNIVILPPWYWNTWSQLLYLLLTIGLLVGTYRFQLNRRLVVAEAKRLRDLDQIKTSLYTNITHEFRTPLTVIQGITDQIQDHETEKTLIRRNSGQLLNLINQMLDLSKLEAGKMELNLVQGDILSFLRYITESFHSLALNQKINLNFYCDEETIEMDYDPDKILQILSNLVSNAIKFTPEYGKVLVTVHRLASDQLGIKIKDTGIGIPPNQLPHVFERFHQADTGNTRPAEGTGIGLPLCKELVTLMDGSIEVSSTLGQGSVFVVCLPIANLASKAPPVKTLMDLNLAPVIPSFDPEKGLSDDRPRLLIVEDNHDVMHYLTNCLKADYQLFYARNGQQGIDQAREIIPDIIISDVMMPEKDGFELCTTLKTDVRTDHIPIILLTAKADMNSKLEGLEYGADAYLTKPFHQQELHIRLQKLVALRQRLQLKYNQPEFNEEHSTQREDAFVLKVRQLILDHLDDEHFGVEDVAVATHISSTHVYRKMKALTGKSTSQFIRQIRMQEALRLMKTTDLNISEIAYSVGVQNVSYFSKIFSRYFGKTASEMAKDLKQKG